MNSKILMFMLLAYFLVNLSTARPQVVNKPKSSGWNNTPDIGKKTLVTNQSIKIHPSVFGNFKVNPVVKACPKITAAPVSPPSPVKTSVPPVPLTTLSAPTFRPSIKNTLPPPKASAPTTVPTNENENHQGFDIVEEEEEEDEDEEEEDEDEEGEEEENRLENSKTVTSQPMLSSLTSKPIITKSLNQENDNHQGFDIVEDEEEDEEDEEGEEEKRLENSKTVASSYKSKQSLSMKINDSSNKFQTSQPMLSSLTSKPTVPESVNQENDNHQGFDIVEEEEEDDEEEEGEEEEEEEKRLENSKTVTSQPMLSSLTSKPTEPESVNQENDNRHNVEEHSKDPNHNTPIDYITINGVQVPMNNFMSTVPQLPEDELTENNYNESEYHLNTNEDHQASYYYDELEPESSDFNNPTEISETLNRKNDNTKDQSIRTNEFELNSSDNTQISTDKQEDTKEDQFKNQYVTENKERIINGYRAMKKILYMLHDYASSTFNWIINKIDYRMEQVSS